MRLIGLTGGVGMGKSTAAEWFEQRGLPVADTDAIARQLVEPGHPACDEILSQFGPQYFSPDGRLRRDLLAGLVFENMDARRRLEAILHPRIRERWLAQAARWRAEGRAAGVVVIPLLFETGAQTEVDAVVCVACSAATQQQRLAARGWFPSEIARRNQAQWPIERKLAAADFVVWNEGCLEVLHSQLDRVLRQLIPLP